MIPSSAANIITYLYILVIDSHLNNNSATSHLIAAAISRKVELPIKISLESTSRPFSDIGYFFTLLVIDDIMIKIWYWL